MPLVNQASYKRPFYLFNAHLETIIPSLRRKVDGVDYKREMLSTPDNDFLDIDWVRDEEVSNKLVILSHGLEGNSERHYMKGMARYFHERGWDVLAWNCRSCSGRMNQQARLYHHADIGDLSLVIDHAAGQYKSVSLVGFSMGGSMGLKYLGHQPHPNIRGAVFFSVPCDLKASAESLGKPSNSFYRKRFLKKLKAKVRAKANQFPEKIDLKGIEMLNSFPEFDNQFTAPLHGFRDSDDFYHQGSANNFIALIDTPTLLVNALNDPMLPPSCFPYELAEDNRAFYFQTTKHGGHAGYALYGKKENWMEVRAFEFLSALI